MKKFLVYLFTILLPVLGNSTASIKTLQNYQQECDNGNLKKCITAGKLMNRPNKGEDLFNFDKAMSNFKKACDGGEWEACYFIAYEITSHPDNAFPEYANYNELQKALKLNAKACDGDVARACYDLGSMYEDGYSTKKNISLSKQYYKKACDLGYDVACNKSNNNTQMPTYDESQATQYKPSSFSNKSDLCINETVQKQVIKIYQEELLSLSILLKRSLYPNEVYNIKLSSIRFNGYDETAKKTFCAAAIQSRRTRDIEYSIQETLDGNWYYGVSFHW